MRPVVIAILLLLTLVPAALAEDFYGTNVISVNSSLNSTPYDWNCYRLRENQIVTFSLWVHNPVNPDFENGQVQDVTAVNGFECRVEATDGVTILGWQFPVPSINVGQGNNLMVGFAEPVPVVEGRAAVATFDVFLGNASFELPEEPAFRCVQQANAWITIHPAYVQSIAGTASYLDANDTQDPLVAAFTASEFADFQFTILKEDPVAADRHTWGAMKALYR